MKRKEEIEQKKQEERGGEESRGNKLEKESKENWGGTKGWAEEYPWDVKRGRAGRRTGGEKEEKTAIFSCALEASQTCRQQRAQGRLASVITHAVWPITAPKPAPSFLSFFLPVFSCLFSSAHDAVWHNETVKGRPVEAGAESESRRGVEGAAVVVVGAVKWHYTRALYLQRASLTHGLFIAAGSFLSVCRALLCRHKHRHQMAAVDLHCAALPEGTRLILQHFPVHTSLFSSCPQPFTLAHSGHCLLATLSDLCGIFFPPLCHFLRLKRTNHGLTKLEISGL